MFAASVKAEVVPVALCWVELTRRSATTTELSTLMVTDPAAPSSASENLSATRMELTAVLAVLTVLPSTVKLP
jgi:hypothetical protein